ncbi:MAG: ABC transporter substrate-binding protein [Wolinella sp.]
MRFLLSLLLFCGSLFAMSEQEIDSYIAQNSDYFELLKSEPKRVYGSTPPLLYLLYALAPEKVAGLIFEFNNFEIPYIAESVRKQPVVGGFFGQGKIPNIEMLLRLDPELILVNASSQRFKKAKEMFGSVKKPMLYLNSYTLEEYVTSLEVLGRILNRQERANKLVAYARESLGLSKKLEEHIKTHNIKKPTIYYAQGSDGLQTECDGSLHVIVVNYSGGEVPYKCAKQGNEYGRMSVSFEQVLGFDPDMIIIHEREFYNKIYDDPKWKLLRAVQQKRVYLIPREPFSWFDRPPSFMRFLGLKWLINLAHPEVFHFDMEREMKEFYQLFLGITLDDSEIKRILGGGNRSNSVVKRGAR